MYAFESSLEGKREGKEDENSVMSDSGDLDMSHLVNSDLWSETEIAQNQGSRTLIIEQTCRGSFSAVPTLILA